MSINILIVTGLIEVLLFCAHSFRPVNYPNHVRGRYQCR